MRRFLGLLLLVMAVSGIALAQEGRSFEGVTKVDTIIGHLGIFDSLRGIYSKWEITTSGDTVEVSVPGLLGIDAGDGIIMSGPMNLDTLTVANWIDATLGLFGNVVVDTTLSSDSLYARDALIADARLGLCSVDSVLTALVVGVDSLVSAPYITASVYVASDSLITAPYMAADSSLTTVDLTATGTVDLGGATDTLTWICLSPADTVRAIIIDGSIRLIDQP